MLNPYSLWRRGSIYGLVAENNTNIATQAKHFLHMSENFQERLRNARESRSLSQADLAKRTGLQPAAISHFETGQRAPSFENLRKLSDALNISVDYLLGRINEEQHGQGIGAAPRAQQLFRHAENLSDDSFDLLKMMAKALREKEEQRKKEEER